MLQIDPAPTANLAAELLGWAVWLPAVLGAAWLYVDASRRGRHATGWALATFLTGPFAVVVLVFYWMQVNANDGVLDPLGRHKRK